MHAEGARRVSAGRTRAQPPLQRRDGRRRWTLGSVAAVIFVLGLGSPRALPADDGVLARLSPSAGEFADAVDELARRVRRATASGDALARLQNALAKRTGLRWFDCSDPSVASVVGRSRLFGAGDRDIVQGLRVQSARVTRMADSPTIAPLLSSTLGARARDLTAVAGGLVERHLEAAAWQARYVQRRTGRCRWEPSPEPGVPDAFPELADSPVAVYALAEGVICPGGEALPGGLLLVSAGLACVGEVTCDCVPAPVLPGAIIGLPR
jgi:hypothetical protein